MSLYNERLFIMNPKSYVLSVQLRAKSGDKFANLQKIEELISPYKNKPLDLLLLPEFFSTGICHNAMVNEPENEFGGETIQKICDIAKVYNTNIVAGSVIEKSNDKLYNTSFAINREGRIVDKYRKIHLFNYFGGTEGERITPGNKPVVIKFDFAQVGINICFDIRYPMHSRKLIQMGAEIIVCPTAWAFLNSLPDKEKQVTKKLWQSLNVARAAENLVYFISADLCGKIDSFLSASGNSMIVSPFGEILENAQEEEKAIYQTIDLEIVRELKKSYPVVEIE